MGTCARGWPCEVHSIARQWACQTPSAIALLNQIRASSARLHCAPGRRMGEALGSFLGTWTAMMAGMMLPSATPMILLHRLGGDGRVRTQLWSAAFVAGDLVVWASVGIVVWGAALTATAIVTRGERARGVRRGGASRRGRVRTDRGGGAHRRGGDRSRSPGARDVCWRTDVMDMEEQEDG